VSSTPTMFINGRSVVGAQPYEYFQTVIDEELARK
jgi:protein-disulfide isomerase